MSMVEKHPSGCWLWNGDINHYGYGRFSFDGKRTLAHRFSVQLFIGAIPASLSVLHRCDVTRCVNPEHLFIGTQADNIADMRAKGRGRIPPARPGEKHHAAKLSADDVVSIRESRDTQVALAKRYGIRQCTVSEIKRRLIWTHI